MIFDCDDSRDALRVQLGFLFPKPSTRSRPWLAEGLKKRCYLPEKNIQAFFDEENQGRE